MITTETLSFNLDKSISFNNLTIEGKSALVIFGATVTIDKSIDLIGIFSFFLYIYFYLFFTTLLYFTIYY